jgi:excisionase family DNA binding protein
MLKNNDAKLLTTGEAAKRLNRSTSAIRKYERQGRIRGMRTESGFRLFMVDEIERFRRELSK